MTARALTEKRGGEVAPALTALFVGDATYDLTMSLSHVPQPDEKVHSEWTVEVAGGVILNSAIACGLAGGRARLLFRTGPDLPGDAILADLKARGVALSHRREPGSTCRVVVLLEPHGEKRLILQPGVSLYPSIDHILSEPLEGVGWVHTAVYNFAAGDALAARCRERGVPWSLDIEPATFDHDIGQLARSLDGAAVVFCNARAAARLGADPQRTLFELGVQSVVMTLGARGVALCAGGEVLAIPAPMEQPIVDTTGAGDCLAGWFIAERLAGLDSAAALRRAVVAATLSCGARGAQQSYPTRAAVERLLERAP